MYHLIKINKITKKMISQRYMVEFIFSLFEFRTYKKEENYFNLLEIKEQPTKYNKNDIYKLFKHIVSKLNSISHEEMNKIFKGWNIVSIRYEGECTIIMKTINGHTHRIEFLEDLSWKRICDNKNQNSCDFTTNLIHHYVKHLLVKIIEKSDFNELCKEAQITV